MKIRSTPLEGMYEITACPIRDSRGRFTRLFCEDELALIRTPLHFVQINLSETERSGSVRGLHYQFSPAAESKMIHCIRGRVFDVAVDIRIGSSTFLNWHAVELSEEGTSAVFIPEGFAHGFQALTDNVQLLYMHTAPWTPASEGGLRYSDPRLAIDWPLPPVDISHRDRSHPLIDHKFVGMHV